jgi:hypothetical protein
VLGWELATILRRAPFDDESVGPDSDGLLRLDSLSPLMLAKLGVERIESNLQSLAGHMASKQTVDPELVARLRLALATNPASLESAIEALHIEALFALAAADWKLGRAYALGHELADICLEPGDRASFVRAFGSQVVCVKDRLADLASSFPPHSSRAVVLSLRAWESWAAEPTLDDRPLAWAKDGAGVQEALGRQGTLWRDLLAGDKDAQDMLDTAHYVKAASSLVATMATTLKRFARPFLLPLVLLALLFVCGVVLLVTGSKVIGAILAAAAAFGITGAGIRARLGDVAAELQAQLWGAELDLAIGEAVLVGPVGWGASVAAIAVPASGAAPKVTKDLEILSEFRRCVAKGLPGEISALLAPGVVIRPPSGPEIAGIEKAADWLLEDPQSKRIASEPEEVKSVRPGVILSIRDTRATVWRVQEGRILRWEGFDDRKTAMSAAESFGLDGLPVEAATSST